MGVKKPRHKKRPEKVAIFLTRHRKVADEYLTNGLNKMQAMRTCGYSDQTSRHAQHTVFGNKFVIDYLAEKQASIQKKYELTEDWIIQRMMKLADSNNILAPFKRKDEDGGLYWDFSEATQEDLSVITGMMTETYYEGKGEDRKAIRKFKIEVPDPKGALDSLMRRMGLFNDKLDVKGEVNFVERLQRGRERARAKMGEERE